MGIYRSEAGKQAVEQQYRDALCRRPVPNRRLTLPGRYGETFVVRARATQTSAIAVFLRRVRLSAFA